MEQRRRKLPGYQSHLEPVAFQCSSWDLEEQSYGAHKVSCKGKLILDWWGQSWELERRGKGLWSKNRSEEVCATELRVWGILNGLRAEPVWDVGIQDEWARQFRWPNHETSRCLISVSVMSSSRLQAGVGDGKERGSSMLWSISDLSLERAQPCCFYSATFESPALISYACKVLRTRKLTREVIVWRQEIQEELRFQSETDGKWKQLPSTKKASCDSPLFGGWLIILFYSDLIAWEAPTLKNIISFPPEAYFNANPNTPSEIIRIWQLFLIHMESLICY